MHKASDLRRRRASRGARLARLRDLMVRACNLAEPLAYFREQLARDAVFCRRSKAGDPGLDPILDAIVMSLYGLDAEAGERSFRGYRGLWHGRCVFPSGEATVLYHREVDAGLVDVPFDGGRLLLRFTVRSWKTWPERPSARPCQA